MFLKKITSRQNLWNSACTDASICAPQIFAEADSGKRTGETNEKSRQKSSWRVLASGADDRCWDHPVCGSYRLPEDPGCDGECAPAQHRHRHRWSRAAAPHTGCKGEPRIHDPYRSRYGWQWRDTLHRHERELSDGCWRASHPTACGYEFERRYWSTGVVAAERCHSSLCRRQSDDDVVQRAWFAVQQPADLQ